MLRAHKRLRRASLMRRRPRPSPTEAVLEVRDATPKPLCKPEIQPPLPRLPLLRRVTHVFIPPAAHFTSLKSYFLSACLLPKPALHQCIRLIESSVLGDSSVMTHDIQLMLSFLPGGLILEMFLVLGWHVARLSCYLTNKSFVRITFKPLAAAIILFPALSISPLSQASHYRPRLSASCCVYWIGAERRLDVARNRVRICATQPHASTHTHKKSGSGRRRCQTLRFVRLTQVRLTQPCNPLQIERHHRRELFNHKPNCATFPSQRIFSLKMITRTIKSILIMYSFMHD